MGRQRFSREFKQETVKQVKERGVSCAQVARDLGIGPNVVSRWVREAHADPAQAFPGHGQRKPDEAEMEKLKREIVRLKAERDILKKAAADSIGQRNTAYSNRNFGGMWYGTSWATRHDRFPEK